MVMEKVSTLVSKDIGNYLTNRASWNIFYNAKAEGLAGDGTTDDYADLSTLINTTINGAEATIIFSPGTYKISTNITIPSNINLFLTKGAMLSPDSGKTITINGPVEAGLWKIFTGSGTIAGSMKVDAVYPQWWGAVVDGTTDDTSAIQKAINVLVGTGGVVFFSAGTFKIASTLTIPQDWIFELRGIGIDSTIIHYTGSGDAIDAIGTVTNQIVKSGITNMRIRGNASAQNGLDMYFCYSFYLRNILFDTFTNGVRIEQSWSLSLDALHVTSCTADGIRLQDESNNVTLTGCEFFNNGNAGAYVNGGRSVNFISCTLETNNYGAYVTSDANGTSHSINFIGCYIEGNTTEEIRVTKEAGSAPTGINFKGNYFVSLTGKATIGIRLVHANTVTVDGNYFSDGTASYLYSLYNSDGASLSNITFGTNQDSSDNGVFSGTGTFYRNENKLIPKAWGRFTVAGGAIGAVNSFNVTSVTYVATGTYQVTLREPMPGTDYCITVTAENGASFVGMLSSAGQPTSTTVFRIFTASDAATLADARTVSFTVLS